LTRIFKMASQFRLACVQMRVSADKQANLMRASNLVAKAVSEHGAQMVVLPECFNCPYSNASFPEYAESLPGPGESTSSETANLLSDVAKRNNIWLIGGSCPEKFEDRLYNTCLIFNPEGQVVAKHRKIHLFNIDIPGGIRFMESETLTGGDDLTVFDTQYCKVGVGICYDMRFGDYAEICQQKGAQIMIYPGAFNTTTGPLHWELLQRGRAVDNQMWVATASPARDPDFSYQAWGHSSIVDPWGKVVSTTGHNEDIVVADIDLEQVAKIRKNIPILKQKRTDLYKLPQWSAKL